MIDNLCINVSLPQSQTLSHTEVRSVTVMEAPTSFSPFSPTDCMLYSHFSFNDFVAIAFLDLAGDLETQI